MKGRAALAMLLTLLLRVGAGVFVPPPASAEPSAEEGAALLGEALDQIYDFDQIRVASVTVTDHRGDALRYVVQMASRRFGDDLRSYGLFTHPPRLRNMAILTIEASNRADDHYLYMPGSGRVRRVSSAQRADSFMGTDLTYEDLERRRASDYRVAAVQVVTVDDEAAYRIRTTPRFGSSVSRMDFDIAVTDAVLLATRSYKEGADRPFRELRAPRASVIQLEGRSLPTRLIVENHDRRTVTVVEFAQLQIAEGLPDSLFSATNLQVRRDVPGLKRPTE